MTNYPLLITFRSAVFGRGFMADVTACGRLVATEEAETDWWLYGVNPGAIAAHGDSLDDAHEDFRAGLQAVLVQFAGEATSLDAFTRKVEQFFSATNGPAEADWLEAVQRVRTNGEQLAGLPVERADRAQISVTVVLKTPETSSPDDNSPRVEAALAKAA